MGSNHGGKHLWRRGVPWCPRPTPPYHSVQPHIGAPSAVNFARRSIRPCVPSRPSSRWRERPPRLTASSRSPTAPSPCCRPQSRRRAPPPAPTRAQPNRFPNRTLRRVLALAHGPPLTRASCASPVRLSSLAAARGGASTRPSGPRPKPPPSFYYSLTTSSRSPVDDCLLAATGRASCPPARPARRRPTPTSARTTSRSATVTRPTPTTAATATPTARSARADRRTARPATSARPITARRGATSTPAASSGCAGCPASMCGTQDKCNCKHARHPPCRHLLLLPPFSRSLFINFSALPGWCNDYICFLQPYCGACTASASRRRRRPRARPCCPSPRRRQRRRRSRPLQAPSLAAANAAAAAVAAASAPFAVPVAAAANAAAAPACDARPIAAAAQPAVASAPAAAAATAAAAAAATRHPPTAAVPAAAHAGASVR